MLTWPRQSTQWEGGTVAVLVDSSIWIAAANPKNKECEQLKQLISKNELIYVTRPIQVEVCQGSKTEEDFQKLWNAFLGFEVLELTTRIWGMSTWNYFRCRKKGVTLSTLDCLMATIAREHGVDLWTLDTGVKRAKFIIGYEGFEPG